MLETRDDSSLTAVIGLARQGMVNLNVEWVKRTGRLSQNGRPRRLEPLAWLLLILIFYVGTMEYKNLYQIFGIPPSTLGRYIIAGEVHFSAAIKKMPDTRVVYDENELPRPLATSSRLLILTKLRHFNLNISTINYIYYICIKIYNCNGW